MIKRDLVVIGGGASGLFAAAIALERGVKVLLIEKNSRCGRKIAITGKGRCNVTNTKPWAEFSTHIHPNNKFFRSAFYAMDNLRTIEFFEKIGLPLVEERGDRVFPKSMRAQDVTDALVAYIKGKGGEILTGTPVTEIIKEGEFLLYSSGRQVASSKSLIIATGGLSYPMTGSTGDGYLFAKGFGHKVTQCHPSLTALLPIGYSEMYHGISLKNIEITLLVNGTPSQVEFGDLDFTNGGIEGPVGFKVSRKAVQNLLNGQKIALNIDLKPAVSTEQLEQRIAREIAQLSAQQQREIENSPAKSIQKYLLPKLMPKQLLLPFVSTSGAITVANLPSKLKGWNLKIASYVGYERCVVTAGGVSLSEISPKSMESKLVPDLYFTGEVLDLDGDTGGYNLQIAFSTAAIAAMNVAAKVQNPS